MNMKIFAFINNKYNRRKFRRRNRSIGGAAILIVVLGFFGIFSLFPLLYTLTSAFKPFSEIFMYPPKLTVENPTLDNFLDLGTIIEDFTVPMSRYIFNTLVITGLGTFGTVLLGSLAAYPLAKFEFPGSKLMSNIIVYALMFSTSVTAIPNYLIMSSLHIVDTYWAVILPAVGGTLGLYLMKNFMVQVPDDMIEAAKIDGASNMYVFRKIIIPLSKPMVATIAFFQVVGYWNSYGPALYYISTRKDLYPVPNYIRNFMSISPQSMTDMNPTLMFYWNNVEKSYLLLSIIPIMCLYPFVFRFIKGGMATGAVKG